MPKKILNDFHIETPKAEVLRRLGKKYKTKITPMVEEKINRIMEYGRTYLKTSAIYDIRPFELYKEKKLKKVIIDKKLTITSKNLYELLKNSANIVIMAATIGDEISREVEKLVNRTRMTDAVILDAYASESVEAAVDYMQGVLQRGMALQGYKLTRRFSPGYGDLQLSEQEFIIDFIDANEIGITLNESNIMFPEKSITALLGLEK